MKVEIITSDIEKFIINLDLQTRARVMRSVELLEKHGHTLGMPFSKSLHDGLFELRIIGKKHVRVLYCFHKDTIYLLNAFVKKTNKVPKKEIDIAVKRFKMLA